LFGLLAGIIFLWISGIPVNTYKRLTLLQVYDKVVNFEKVGDFTSEYDLLLPSRKINTSLDSFVSSRDKKTIYSETYTINNVEIKDDKGIIDRILHICYSSNCQGTDKIEITGKKIFYFVNGNWYMDLNNNLVCSRTSMYPMPPEFSRGISLAIQRLTNSVDSSGVSRGKNLDSVKNCLDIQYAQSDQNLSGAEGFFLFNKSSAPEHLQIIVSPKYSASDDLLTATLLAHEMTHAYLHSTGIDQTITCYENEADAFTTEYIFVRSLTDEERNSISQRYYNQSSQAVMNLLETINGMLSYQGSSYYDKALNYVKASYFYQNQCGY